MQRTERSECELVCTPYFPIPATFTRPGKLRLFAFRLYAAAAAANGVCLLVARAGW